MSYASRVYRQRNAHSGEETKNDSFFSKKYAVNNDNRKSKFFQTKLSVNRPGDSYEQEADAVASAVVNRSSQVPAVQQKKISSIQRMTSGKEEEKLSTNDERMRKDKEIQAKPEIQRKNREPEKEKKDLVQKMDEPEKKEEKMIQQKSGGATTAASSLSGRIENSNGKGRTLPAKTLSEMNSSFGTDFSNVKIHTDAGAVQMNKELNAQAFTHGKNIYFNNGKYDTESSNGRQLLAHELTHVVQQNGGGESPLIQRKTKVNPATKINEVIAELNAFCPEPITDNGDELQANCDTFDGSTQGCDCAKQVICDPKRLYTVNVRDCTATPKKTTLWDQSVADVPESNFFPDTRLGDNPVTQICDPNTSNIEFGAFDPNGDAIFADAPRVLAHEICGHGLFRTGPGVPTGNRPSHDSTINIENSISAERGQAARGHFSDRHQGESFFRIIGDSNIVFKIQDGTHFESPIHNLTSLLFAGDAILEDIFDGKISSNLHFGARGEAVRKVQEALVALGFPLPVFGADSIYKNETLKALVDYQRSRKLNPDGIVGAQTMRALENDMSSIP